MQGSKMVRYSTEIVMNKIGFYFKEYLKDDSGQKVTVNPFPNRNKALKRGKIAGFSASSKKRMMQKIISIGELPTDFITLTFPKSFPTGLQANRMMDKFTKNFVKQGASFIWRMELQKRGAPHYHLLCYGMSEKMMQSAFKVWSDRMIKYNESCKASERSLIRDIKQRCFLREDLQSSNDEDLAKKVFLYVAKYSSKAEEVVLNPDGSPFLEKMRGFVQYPVKISTDWGYSDVVPGFVHGDGMQPYSGRAWGFVGRSNLDLDTVPVVIDGNVAANYLVDLAGANPEFCRKYHVFANGEDEFFLSYYQNYVKNRQSRIKEEIEYV